MHSPSLAKASISRSIASLLAGTLNNTALDTTASPSGVESVSDTDGEATKGAAGRSWGGMHHIPGVLN